MDTMMKNKNKMNFAAWLLIVAMLLTPITASAERIKDLASIEGVRSNQLIGYGLVVGLDGSGDSSSQPFTVQSLKNMLAQLGVVVPPGIKPQLKNAAAVMISAELPPFVKPGQTIDITVSSVGNSKSLRGGTLLMSPLKGVDGQIYAIAQGSLMVSGVGAEGSDGSSVVKNIPSVGRIPNGATVERSVPNPFDDSDSIVFNLNTPDFTTTSRMVESINSAMGLGTAAAIDGSSVRVHAPQEVDKKVMFVSMLENLAVDPGEAPARVIINARTGTVVIGSNVVVMSAAVSHGSLAVTIAEDTFVSQPGPFSEGDTEVVAKSSIEIAEETGAYMIKPGITLGEIVSAVNRVGASPSDLMAVLDALKQAGALKAELIVM